MSSFHISGVFEYHITVKIASTDDIANLESFCSENGLKLTIIELPSGLHPVQVMVGAYIVGDYAHVYHEIHEKILGDLQDRGFIVNRLKIESIISNNGVPIDYTSKKEQSPLFDQCYFEFHWKIQLDPENPALSYDKLNLVANDHGKLYLSKNVYKKVSKNCHHVFLTMRNMCDGKNESLEEYYYASAFIERHGFKIVKSEREFVVYDSNLKLDDQWTN